MKPDVPAIIQPLPENYRYKGGIQTLHDVLLRCRRPADSDCWIWSLTTMHAQGRTPMCSIVGRTRMSTRRAAWLLSGRPLKIDHIVWNHCGEMLCCNPEHCRAGSRRQAVQHQARTGSFATHSRKKASARRGRQCRRLTDDQARAVLIDPRTSTEIARELGVSRQAIGALRRGKHYADIQPRGDVFALGQTGTIALRRGAR